MKNTILTIAFFVQSLSIHAQAVTLSDLKGVWRSNINENNYYIFYNDSLALIGVIDNKLFISCTRVGFIDPNDRYIQHLDSLQNGGRSKDIPLYIRVNIGWNDREKIKLNRIMDESGLFYDGGLSALGVETPIKNGVIMEIINSNVHSYTKISDLPSYIIIKLLQKYPKENRSYLKNLLDKSFQQIAVSKAILYSLPQKTTKMYLLEGDEVEIIEEKEEWLKVRYYGKKIIEGWIKKSDVEMN
jgi:hypothetical protein